MKESKKEKKRSILAPSRPRKKLLNLSPTSEKKEPSKKQKQTKVVKEQEKSESRRKMKILFEWQAPERIWKPKTRVWYLTSTVVVMILILIMAKFGYFIIILGLIAVLLLWFIQGALEPWDMLHKITSKGIYTNGKMIEWDEIEHFWFTLKKDQVLLQLFPKRDVPLPRLTILVNPEGEFEIFSLLHEHVSYASPEDIGLGFVSRIVDGEYLPLSLFLPDLDQPIE